MNIGDKIREQRIKLGLSQEELALKMGYNGRSTIAKIESGAVEVSHTKVVQYAKILGVSVDYLLGTDDDSVETNAIEQPAVHITVGQRIRKRRKELNMSVDELAERIGKDRATIYRYEKGEIENMPMALLQPTADALEVTISYLMGLEDEETVPIDAKPNSLGVKIRNARKSKGLTQEELGKLLGVEKSAVAKYENGRIVNLKHATLIKLSEILGISPAELINDDQPTTNENESRSIFAHNLQYYVKVSGRTQKEIAEELGVSTATFCDWVKGKKFPRIDKIELLAEYFGVQKADLIDHNPETNPEVPSEKDESESMRKTFAANLKMQMAKHGKSRKDVSDAIGVSYFTFSDWVNAKKYPRMNKIEALANYFGIPKLDLIEEGSYAEPYTTYTPITVDSEEIRKIFATNLKRQMQLHGKSRMDICEALDISYSTFTEWANARKYPRMDKIELLASYFGISKSDLIEKKQNTPTPTEKMPSQVLKKRSATISGKKILAKNLRFYITQSGKTREEIAMSIGVSISTLNSWIYASSFPPLENMEALASCLGIQISDLTQEKSIETLHAQKAKNEVLDIMVRLHSDPEFLSIVELLSSLDKEKLLGIRQMISAFLK